LSKLPDNSLELEKRGSQESLPEEPKQTDSSSNWMVFYATFPKYHCTLFNSIQVMMLAEQTDWGKVVLWSLYLLESILIITQHVFRRKSDWNLGPDVMMGIAIWMNFSAITIFQHATSEFLFGGIGCFANVIPVAVPMLICFSVTEFGTTQCLQRYVVELNAPVNV